MHDVLPGEFRHAMGRLAKGVSVATTLVDGRDHAMTVDSFTSVSLDPVLVLICVEKDARFHSAVLDAGRWGVTVLSAAQRPAAQWFATRGRPLVGQLDGWPTHRAPSGVALLDGGLAEFDVETRAVHPAGDHSVIIGEVVGLKLASDPAESLVFYRGGFAPLA